MPTITTHTTVLPLNMTTTTNTKTKKTMTITLTALHGLMMQIWFCSFWLSWFQLCVVFQEFGLWECSEDLLTKKLFHPKAQKACIMSIWCMCYKNQELDKMEEPHNLYSPNMLKFLLCLQILHWHILLISSLNRFNLLINLSIWWTLVNLNNSNNKSSCNDKLSLLNLKLIKIATGQII
jgi:hypothetical protein